MKNFAWANYDVINVDLDIDWENLLQCGVDECVSRFYSVLNKWIEKNVLDHKIKFDTDPVSYTSELKNLIHEKKELHALWKESNFTENYFEFSSLRAKYLELSRELYKSCLCNIESNINKNTKSFWSYVHRFKKGN